MEWKKEKFKIPKIKLIKHKSKFIPDGYRCSCVLGSSNTGKTCLLPNIITKLHPYTNIILFVKNPDQLPYQFIKKYSEEIGADIYEDQNADYNIIERLKDQLIQCDHNVVIIDDITEKKQLEKLIPIAVSGRHYNISSYWLMQDFYLLPKTIRLNLNEIYLLRTDNIHLIYESPSYIVYR
jgi:hypothetical protein